MRVQVHCRGTRRAGRWTEKILQVHISYPISIFGRLYTTHISIFIVLGVPIL